MILKIADVLKIFFYVRRQNSRSARFSPICHTDCCQHFQVKHISALQLKHRAEHKYPEEQKMDKEPRCADVASMLIGAITSAISQYFKVRAGPSGVVCESLGNHYHGLCITSISQVCVNNLSFKN